MRLNQWLKPTIFLMLLLTISVLSGKRVSAGVGSVSNVSPNNAFNMSNGAGREAWSIVSSCYGSNCMKARNTLMYVYVPSGVNTFDLTIKDGCFRKGVDEAFYYYGGDFEESSSSTYTEYHMYNSLAGSVFTDIFAPNIGGQDYLKLSSGNLTTKSAEGGVSLCRRVASASKDIVRTVTVNHAATPSITVSGVSYSVYVFRARSNTTFYYANQFRLSANNGVQIGFSAINVNYDGETAWTGVSSATESSGNTPQWQFYLEFAPPCTTTPQTYNRTFAWFDADNGLYQFNNELKYSIEELTRNDVPTGIVYSGILTGGNDAQGSVNYNYNSNYKYRLRVYNIAEVNSQQFRLPFDQMYAKDTSCANVIDQTTCSIANPNVTVSASDTFVSKVNFAIPSGVSVPAGSSTTGLHFGIALEGDPSSWNATTGFTIPPDLSVPPPDKQDKVIAVNSGLNNAGYYSFTWTDGFTYRRIYVANASSANSDITLKAPSTAGAYVVVIRLLDRSGGKWLPNYCKINLTVQATPPSLMCTLNSPSQIEVGEPYYPEITIENSATSPEDATVTVDFSMVGPSKTATGIVPIGQSKTFSVSSYSPSPDYVFSPDSYVVPPGLGSHTATYKWSYLTASIPKTDKPDCTVEVDSVNKPYFRVLGGDIRALNSTNTIAGWNKIGQTYAIAPNDSSGKSGAGAQGMIVSQNVISGVVSGALLPTLVSPKDLTLSNTGNINTSESSQYGGGYVIAGYTFPTVNPSGTINGTMNSGDIANGAFSTAGNLKTNNLNVPAGTHMTILVNGDLEIDGDITYPGSYADINSVPHLRFIVNGNINIKQNVSRIDAELIARGNIDTCVNGSGVNPFGACGNNPLIVNGSLTAMTKVHLNRLVGTLRNSASGDGYNGSNAGNIAETVKFGMEQFISSPGGSAPVALGNRYDSITALPPLF